MLPLFPFIYLYFLHVADCYDYSHFYVWKNVSVTKEFSYHKGIFLS